MLTYGAGAVYGKHDRPRRAGHTGREFSVAFKAHFLDHPELVAGGSVVRVSVSFFTSKAEHSK